MKEITILSGKGGTGKTSITAALASVAQNTVFCDNDVDASDLHLIFQPEILETHSFSSGWLATINNSDCTQCETCINNCRFDAIHYNTKGELEINPYQCEGCRLCERICPAQAITSIQNDNNAWFISKSRFGDLVHAAMGPGEENSGKLVTQIRRKAKEIAKENNADFIINDGPPGIGCATISSLAGTDAVLIVIEPSKTGLHDAKRLIELINSFNIQAYAIINKFNINTEFSNEIAEFLKSENIPLLSNIPFNNEMVKAMNSGKTIIEYKVESEIANHIKTIWDKLKEPIQ